MTKEGAELLMAYIQQGDLAVKAELHAADVCRFGEAEHGYKVRVTLVAGQRTAIIKNALDWLAMKHCWYLIAKDGDLVCL